MLMMNSLWKLTLCKSSMHIVIILLLTLQLFYEKMPLQWCLKFFMVRFQPTLLRRRICVHYNRTILRIKIIHSIVRESHRKKIIPKTKMFTFIPHENLDIWIFFEHGFFNFINKNSVIWWGNILKILKYFHWFLINPPHIHAKFNSLP